MSGRDPRNLYVKKILFHSINGVGLGHLNRCLVLADAISRLDTCTEIFFVTNALFTRPLESSGYRFAKVELNAESNSPGQDCSREPKPYFGDSHFFLFKQFIEREKPDLIVYDSYFDKRVVYYCFERRIKNIFILRRKRPKSMQKFFQGELAKIFTRILIPHSEKEFLNKKDGLLILDSIRAHHHVSFSGYICRNIDFDKIGVVGEKYRLSEDEFLVTVSCGGGGCDCYNESPCKLLESVSMAYKILKQKINNLRMILISGPYSDFRDDKVEVVSYEPHLLELISMSDLYVSAAGYNACNEIIVARTPSVLVPLSRYEDSQLERARGIQRKGVAEVITEFNAGALADVVLKLYSNPEILQKMKRNFDKIKLDIGNTRAARKILEVLRE